LASCDLIFPSLKCQGFGTKRAHNFLFPKSSFRIRRTTDLGMFKDSAIILDAIRRLFLNKLGTTAMFTSDRVDFGRPHLSSFSTSSLPFPNREYHLKLLIGSQPHCHKPLHQYYCFCPRQTGFETTLYGNSLFISTVHDV